MEERRDGGEEWGGQEGNRGERRRREGKGGEEMRGAGKGEEGRRREIGRAHV